MTLIMLLENHNIYLALSLISKNDKNLLALLVASEGAARSASLPAYFPCSGVCAHAGTPNTFHFGEVTVPVTLFVKLTPR